MSVGIVPETFLDKEAISLPLDLSSISKMPGPEDASTSQSQSPAPPTTFKSLGLIDPLLEALDRMGYKKPTDIQVESIPHALEGRDIIGIAATGSGKTAAFALPILQKLWEEPKGLFACVLAPTRELAYQISEQFEALGSAMGVRCAVVVGGMDMPTQQIALAKRPHVVIGTPGRLLDHLETTKGFSLRTLKFLVRNLLDEYLASISLLCRLWTKLTVFSILSSPKLLTKSSSSYQKSGRHTYTLQR